MSSVPIEPRSEFSFIRLPRRGLPEGAQLLRNFNNVPPPNDDVLFYKLLCRRSDGSPDGDDSRDRVEVLEFGEYQERVNEIALDVINISRRRSEAASIESTTREEWGKYLSVMYIAFWPTFPRWLTRLRTES